MNKLQIVTKSICELLKGVNLESKYIAQEAVYDDNKVFLRYRYVEKFKPIREVEVLMALDKMPPFDYNFAIESDGSICKLTDKSVYYSHDSKELPDWQLGQPLSSQSPETIEFLFTVLNCEG